MSSNSFLEMINCKMFHYHKDFDNNKVWIIHDIFCVISYLSLTYITSGISAPSRAQKRFKNKILGYRMETRVVKLK